MVAFNIQSIEGIVAIISSIVGVAGAGLKFFRYLKKKHANWLSAQLVAAFEEKNKLIVDTNQKIDQILKEVTPNGGGSMKDKINHINESLKENTELTKKIFHRQRWILDERNEPIFETDNNGKCIWVNKAYCILFKKDIKEFMGNGWKNNIAEHSKDRVYQEWDRCMLDGRKFEMIYDIVDSDGKSHHVKCVATKTEDGGYMGSYDIMDSHNREVYREQGYE